MSDDPTARILAAIEGLGQRMERLDQRMDRLRADVMERLDRHQARLDSMDEHLTAALGYIDRVDHKTSSLAEDNRLLGEIQMSTTRLLRRLEGRIKDVEERP
jgi:chromosome segregation ATPase